MSNSYSSKTTEFQELWFEIKKILDYLMSSQLQEVLFPLKIIFILISICFLSAIFYLIAKDAILKWKFYESLRFVFMKDLESRKIVKKWKKIKKNLVKAELEAQWKINLIDALDIFDQSLKKIGYTGTNLKERINKLSSEQVPELDKLIKIQSTYEDMIQIPDYHLSKEQAQEIFDILEKILINLEIL